MVFDRTSRLALSTETFLFVFLHPAWLGLSPVLIVVVKSDGNCHPAIRMMMMHSSSSDHYKTCFWPALHLKVSHTGIATNYGFLRRYLCGEISLFISKYQSWWLGQCIEIAGSDSPTGILFGQQICPPVRLVTWSPPSLSHYCGCWWFIVSLPRLSSWWWYYAMVAVLTRGSDARLACTSS